jgi:hypothetical protein
MRFSHVADLFEQLHGTERLAHKRRQTLPDEVDGIGMARYEYDRQERPANSAIRRRRKPTAHLTQDDATLLGYD